MYTGPCRGRGEAVVPSLAEIDKRTTEYIVKVAGHRVESKEILNITYDKATILTKY